MYKKLKKLMALAIAGTLAVAGSLLPTLAETTVFSGGTGTEADPYLISNAADLVNLSTLSLGSSAADYNGKYYKVTADIDMTDVTEFKGIGWGTRFSGVFDGDYHAVKNLTFSSDGFAGFFNLADGATIKNLGLENTGISGDCTQGIGGFIGRNFNDKGTTTIENCYVRKITLTNSNTNSSLGVGAFVGNEAVAGIIIKNCYSTQLSGTGIQGLVGNRYGAPQGGSTISNCYSTGTPWSKFGTADPANTTNVYRIQTTATEEQMAGLGSAFSADVKGVNNGLPVLAWEAKLFSGGTGTEADPYLISTADDLVELSTLTWGTNGAAYKKAAYRVTADIDLNNNSKFKGIAADFTGIFDGGYHVIKNVTVDTGDRAGFFIAINPATIKNLGIENISLSGKGHMGGLVGRSLGQSVIDNCFVRGVTITYTDNTANKGGLIGCEALQQVKITNTYTSDIKTTGIFGICGNQYGSIGGDYTIENVYSTYSVSNILNKGTGTHTNLYQITTAATEEQMAGLGSAFAADVKGVNNGLPVLAWEAKLFSGGTGTAADPYLISTADDLIELSTLTRGTNGAAYKKAAYKVTADIDLNNNSEFKGIAADFTGTFDGGYHVIKNVTIDTGGQAGFFIAINPATIKNLGIENISLSGNGHMGGLVGRSLGQSVIDNCFVRGVTITPTDGNTANKGGLIGCEALQQVKITNTYTSDIKTGGIFGICGNQWGSIGGDYTIQNVYSTYDVSNIINNGTGTHTNLYQITTSATEEQMTGLGSAFAQDKNSINSGLPVLAWEKSLSLGLDDKVTVINNTADFVSGVLIVIAYDEYNTMLDVCVRKDVELSANGRAYEQYDTVTGAAYYKAFLWTDMTELEPLCKSVSRQNG